LVSHSRGRKYFCTLEKGVKRLFEPKGEELIGGKGKVDPVL
jgi:hypothetical protein